MVDVHTIVDLTNSTVRLVNETIETNTEKQRTQLIKTPGDIAILMVVVIAVFSLLSYGCCYISRTIDNWAANNDTNESRIKREESSSATYVPTKLTISCCNESQKSNLDQQCLLELRGL